MKHPESKVIHVEEARIIAQKHRDLQQKIVFTNGCFDIIHKGHIDYLYKAKQLGNVLFVGLNSDFSIQGMDKSPARPLQDESARSWIVSSLYFVDYVILFDEPTPLLLIEQISPHILVKGADYKAHEIVGYEWVVNSGGSVSTIPFLEGYSTSQIEQKILKSH